MKTVRFIILLSIFILQQMLTGIEVSAQDGSISITSEISYIYGENLDFSARFTADQDPVRAVIFLRSDSDGYTDVLNAEKSSGNYSTLSVSRDLSLAPLTPFSRWTYWWHLDFPDGTSYDSTPQIFQYYDNRYVWNFASGAFENTNIQVFWKSNAVDTGQTVIDLTAKILPDLQNQLSISAPGSVSIFIYQHPEEMLPATNSTGEAYISGTTLPIESTILLVVTDDQESVITLEQLLPHELTHLMLYQRMGDSYDNLPNWLAEGLSVLHEETPDPVLRLALEEAFQENQLLSLQSLCGTFPSQDQASILAYAQSASFLQYLLDIYGIGGLSALLDAYQEGATCEGGLSRVFQRDLSVLDSEWQASLGFPGSQVFSIFMPWLLLAIPLLLLLIYTLFLRHKPAPE
ncbi:MAG: hypothetical protein JXA25_19940 [Anaerolineales bacterium]|nr:hypothetical protein [Anaerolineales bacterium]